jgi:glutamine---fructose-6-phosphate transaminase (isomerizing)
VTTRLEVETAEQPRVLAALLDAQLPRLDEWRAALRSDEIDGVVVVARGSSDNAARYAQYLWSLRTGHPVTLATPSLHTVYGRPLDVSGRAVVAISQSGASPDVVEVLRAASLQGSPTVAVTNNPASPLAEVADAVLELGAGEERSVAATKTYTASLMAVAVLALALDTREGQDRQGASAHERDLRAVPDAMTSAVDGTTGLGEASRVLADAYRGVVVGRGLNLCTAYETALKITELTGSLMAPYSPADLLHGPVGAVGPEVPVVLIAPDEPASASVLEVAEQAQRRDAPVVLVGAEGTSVDGPVAATVELPTSAAVADWLTPLIAVVPGQLLARSVAELRGIDVDHPGGLSKVTRTT